MYTSIIALAFALSASAAPLTHVVRSAPTNFTQPAYWNTSGITNTTSAPTSSKPAAIPYAEPIATVYPDFTSQYNAATGAVDFHSSRGYVSRSPKNNGADISTLVTFQLDKKYASNECQIVFDLSDASSSASGSKKAQLFTSLAPATADSKSWPSGNLRNQELGSIQVFKGGRASWEAGSGAGASAQGFFPCSAIAGMIYGGEVVPQGDEVEFSWPAGKDGVKIIVW